MAGWIVYILRCADGTLYTGITNDLKRRLSLHERGTGARYTRGRAPFRIAYTETCTTKGAALKREAAIKKMKRESKIALVTRKN